MNPWEQMWEIVDPLAGGGQGNTFIVRSKQTAEDAVMKTLKNDRHPEARARMFQEVANLRVVHSAGGKVPKYLDGNTERYEEAGLPLYFVMERIDGKTLASVMEERKALSLTEAVALSLDLCKTIQIGHAKTVLHRDLKPENIIVRSLTPPDAVIVDFGLSFNIEEASALTGSSETIDSKFLSLPEGRAIGDNRRDPRSDLTGLCGILYYCLTGKQPRVLQDSDGNAPHRRAGCGVRERLNDPRRSAFVEAFFDRGFAPRIGSRFQSSDELMERLVELTNPALAAVTEDPIAVAAEASDLLFRHDRTTQLREFAARTKAVRDKLEQYMHANGRKLGRFSLDHYHINYPPEAPPGETLPQIQHNSVLAVEHHETKRVIAYFFVAAGDECSVLRGVFAVPNQMARAQQVGSWRTVLKYNGLTEPDSDVVVGDYREAVAFATRDILKEIAPQASS